MLRHSVVRRAVLDAQSLVACKTASASRNHPASSLLQTLRSFTRDLRSPSIALSIRAYATAAATPARARKTATTTTKRATKPRSKAKAKTKKKPAAKKKKKVVAKKKPARKPKRVLTDIEKKRLKVRQLRSKALLTGPKPAPKTALRVYVASNFGKGSSLGDLAKTFASLPADGKAALTATAEANRAANERQLKEWVESHTVEEIQIANNARLALNRVRKEPVPAGTQSLVGRALPKLPDSRVQKQKLRPYASFTKSRWASGDYQGVPVGDAAKSIGREWKALSPSEKASYA